MTGAGSDHMFPDGEARFRCGPVMVHAKASTPEFRKILAANLGLYHVAWGEPEAHLRLEVIQEGTTCAMGAGNYLKTQRTTVDVTESGLAAAAVSGVSARFEASEGRWTLFIPDIPLSIWPVTDLEHLLSLVLTTAWRNLGWVPLHAGGVCHKSTCALLCTTSGGGKTTLTVAMIRERWKTLGDDKLLIRRNASGKFEARALVHAFNLYPHARAWFPEIGDISRLPHYSAWTEKRKVFIETIWPGKTTAQDIPTHLVSVSRDPGCRATVVCPLNPADTLSALLHQTVVPTHRETAGRILSVIAEMACRLKGISVRIGEDAYRHPEDVLGPLGEAMQ